jgi:hypothetical protein
LGARHDSAEQASHGINSPSWIIVSPKAAIQPVSNLPDHVDAFDAGTNPVVVDGFSMELFYSTICMDKPKEEWPRDAEGGLAMYTKPLDLRKLLSEAPDLHLPPGPRDL